MHSNRKMPGRERALQHAPPAALLLLTSTLALLGQATHPIFTGIWSSASRTSGSVAASVTEIKQTGATIALRPVISNQPSQPWSIFSTDGKLLRDKVGRHVIERTGRWSGNRLILEETGPGNAPWRRSTEQRILSLSSDGNRLVIRVNNLRDKERRHDHSIESQRVAH
jgi:hypothetical protein